MTAMTKPTCRALRTLWVLLLTITLASCAATGAQNRPLDHPEATPYTAASEHADAHVTLVVSEAAAAVGNKMLLIVFGADWCHDSRALAGWLETPRFKALIDAHYELVYIDAGIPQKGEGKNLDLIAEYGLSDIEGTPNLLVVEPGSRTLLNADTAKSWRNAASRSGDAIFDELANFVSHQEGEGHAGGEGSAGGENNAESKESAKDKESAASGAEE